MRINIVATKMTSAYITESPIACFAVNCRCHYTNNQISTWYSAKSTTLVPPLKNTFIFYKTPKHIILGTSHIT